MQHLAYRWGRHADEQTGVYAAPHRAHLSAAPSVGVIIVDITFTTFYWLEITLRSDGSIYRSSAANFVARTGGNWA